ncbi:hypothetical protein EDD37DRAFT_90594 [Exophiala viscosa]|uniref:uncharacterized protein n=1 Tax=Exophiala viscosa TaxID=2486360 RepID=UPI0021A221C5|nr:hypothetical protein EDD37DRAFT_90594 [Exophiala viscosa]
MVQYDQFDTMFKNGLPTREKATNCTCSPPETPRSPSQSDVHMHPQLRRLSSSHNTQSQHCSCCHMKRGSFQDLSLTRSHSHHNHNHSGDDEESWDNFCPDIQMPTEMPPRVTVRNHTRRHSGLCPGNVVSQTHSDGTHSPTQMTTKHNSGFQHNCHCEVVTPTENLSERYGLIEEPGIILEKRASLEKEAANKVSEIMHDEMVADMEARSPDSDDCVSSY